MLNKLLVFDSRKRKPPFGSLVPLNIVRHPRIPVVDEKSSSSSSALRIIHAGGTTECYYMAVPASRIMEKYPSFILARPEIFRRPWDSVVQADEILVPGQKFLVVPLRTVKKLRRRIRKPNLAFVSGSDELVSKRRQQEEEVGDARKSSIRKAKNKVGNHHHHHHHHRVSFVGVVDSSNSVSKSKSGRVRNALTTTWEPSLTVIAESHE